MFALSLLIYAFAFRRPSIRESEYTARSATILME